MDLTNEYREQLQEIIDDIGFDDLRKMIDDLESDEADAATERSLGDAWEAGFADNH